MAFNFMKIASAVNPLTVGTALLAGSAGGRGSNIPSFDTTGLQNQISQSADRRKALITGLAGQLPGLTNQYTTSQKQAGQIFAGANTAAATSYKTGLEGLGTEADAARQEALRSETEKTYRNVPQQQQAIREAIGASGTAGNAAVRAETAQPLIQASQHIADLTSQFTQQGLNQADARREAGVTALYNSAEGNALTQLGIDQNTASTLLSTGRADLIQQAADLAGLDKDTLNATLGLSIAGQEANIAKAQADAARKKGLISAIGGIGGAVVGGMSGGLPGASLGSNLGSNAGNLIYGVS